MRKNNINNRNKFISSIYSILQWLIPFYTHSVYIYIISFQKEITRILKDLILMKIFVYSEYNGSYYFLFLKFLSFYTFYTTSIGNIFYNGLIEC